MNYKFKLVLTLTSSLFLVLLWVLYTMYSIYQYSFVRDDVVADAVIVLGAAVWQDEPSPVFETRIKHGIELFDNKKAKFLIFTGGVGNDDKLAESLVAKIYAVNAGVPAESILTESSSHITWENLGGAKNIMNKNGLTSALIVSDPLHMKRAITMARDLGIKAYSSPVPDSRYKTWSTKSKFISTETYYYFGHLIRNLLNQVDQKNK